MKLTINDIFLLLQFRIFMSKKGALGKWKSNFLKDKKQIGVKPFENKTRITILEIGEYLVSNTYNYNQMIKRLESSVTFNWQESIEGRDYWADLFVEFEFALKRITMGTPLYNQLCSMAIQIYKNH